MPELPDLTVFSRNLSKALTDQTITDIEVYDVMRVNATAEKFKSALVGADLLSIRPDGKETVFYASSGHAFSVHLMLNGKFSLVREQGIAAIRSKILCVRFSDGQALVISDFQGLCKVTLDAPPSGAPSVFAPDFDRMYFEKILDRNGRMNMKALLLNQKLLRGIGNAYADEILWVARISPESTAGKIPPEKREALFAAIGDVLHDAIEHITRLAPDAISGEVRSFLRVHNPKLTCTDDGEPILCKNVATKKTYYTAAQVLYL